LLPKKYQAAYRQSLDNPESLSLLDLIALTDSRIANLVSRLNQAGDEKTESVVWNKIIGLAQARMKLSEVETRRVLALTVTYVSRKEAFGLITALFESIKQHVNETTP
jgi:nitrogen-specific signal transduction histidine kinase